MVVYHRMFCVLANDVQYSGDIYCSGVNIGYYSTHCRIKNTVQTTKKTLPYSIKTVTPDSKDKDLR